MASNKNNLEDFERFMEQRQKASSAFLDGDVGPLVQMSVTRSPATLFPPSGFCIEGATAVNDANENGAASFVSGIKNTFEVMHQDADESLAYWTGLQRSTVKMAGQQEAVVFNLRVTEIFRKENESWKLMHRHADKLVTD